MNIRSKVYSFAGGALLAGPAFVLFSMQQMERDRSPLLTAEQREILGHLTIVHLDDGYGGTLKTIRVTGTNLQVVNGLGTTNGNLADPGATDPALTAKNGLGNLIVGYNELGNVYGDDRTGSHNVVIGSRNTYTEFGGVISGWSNTIGAAYSSVIAGAHHQALGIRSSITGGFTNTTTSTDSSISGGGFNTASGTRASITGGRQNQATDWDTCVAGGWSNVASGFRSAIAGGRENVASGTYATVTGGLSNTASADYATVSGGELAQATGAKSWVGGGSGNMASGAASSIVGGHFNEATGIESLVAGGWGTAAWGIASVATGGSFLVAPGAYDWVSPCCP